MPRGYFITFEGLDGSGKTTQLRLLAAALEAAGHRVVTLRNPGGTPLGDRIRSVILDSRSDSETGGIVPQTELALMFADRAQSLHQVILPALASGAIVLCDRYTDSSETYQGAGRNLGADRVLAVHQAICDNIFPDLTLLLLPPLTASLGPAPAPATTATSSVQARTKTASSARATAFYTRVYEQYRVIAAARTTPRRHHPRGSPHRGHRIPHP